MSIRSQEARSEQRRVFLRPKTDYGLTAPAFAAANTMRVRSFKHSLKRKREDREDNRQTLGNHQKVPMMKEGTWNLDMVLQGSGALGSVWSCSPLLAFAFGSELITPATSVVYTPNDAQSALGWLDWLDEQSEVKSWELRNCWMNEMKISAKGGSNPRLMASGGVSDWIFTGSNQLDGAQLLGVTDDIALDSVRSFRVGSRVIIGTSNPGGTGHTISVVDTVNTDINVAPGLASNQADNAIVRPWVPTEAAVPFEVPGMRGDITIDGQSFAITEFELSVTMGLEAHDDQAFVDVVEDYSRSWRKITGFVKFKAFRDQVHVLQDREEDHNRYPINVELGDTAGDIMEIDLPQAELDFGDVEIPDGKGAVTVTLPFDAMTSDDVTSDEGSITLR